VTTRRAALLALAAYTVAGLLVGLAVLAAFGPLVAVLLGAAAAVWALAEVVLVAARAPAAGPGPSPDSRSRPATSPHPALLARHLWRSPR
jgi:membrane associated rhomboid family serine protease